MKTIFLKNFLKNWRQTGSITPSSRFLTVKMLKFIDFSKDLVIVELGPGTGVFTEKILLKLKPDSKLIALEINKEFYKRLKEIKDRRLTVLEVSATNLSSVLEGKKVDVIISGIPFSSIKKDLKEEMLLEIKQNLKEKGLFIQFQYSLDLHKLLKRIFNNKVKIDFVSLNIPPAFIYTCTV